MLRRSLLGRSLLGRGLFRRGLLGGGLLRRRNRDTGDLERVIWLALGWRLSGTRRWWRAASRNGNRNSGGGHRGGDIVYGNSLCRLCPLRELVVEGGNVTFL